MARCCAQARVCAPYGVPVLGVNMGHLGFLTEIQRPEDWEATLDALQANRYWIEERMMIDRHRAPRR